MRATMNTENPQGTKGPAGITPPGPDRAMESLPQADPHAANRPAQSDEDQD